MLKKDIKPHSEKYMFFDFESKQILPQKHIVNYCIAHYFTGEERKFTNVNDFCTWVFDKKRKGYTFIAHYGKGYDFQFQRRTFNNKSKFCKFKMADGRHIQNRFFLYLGALLADQREIRKGDVESHANIRHVTKMAIFRKLKMADGRHFENSFISISQP